MAAISHSSSSALPPPTASAVFSRIGRILTTLACMSALVSQAVLTMTRPVCRPASTDIPTQVGMPRIVGTAVSRRYARAASTMSGRPWCTAVRAKTVNSGPPPPLVVRLLFPTGAHLATANRRVARVRCELTCGRRAGRFQIDAARVPSSVDAGSPIALSDGQSVISVTRCAFIAWLSPEALDLGAATSYIVVSVANGEGGTSAGNVLLHRLFEQPDPGLLDFTLTWRF